MHYIKLVGARFRVEMVPSSAGSELKLTRLVLSTKITLLSNLYFSCAPWRMHPDPCYVSLIRCLLLLSLSRTIKPAVNCYLSSDTDKNKRPKGSVIHTLGGILLAYRCGHLGTTGGEAYITLGIRKLIGSALMSFHLFVFN